MKNSRLRLTVIPLITGIVLYLVYGYSLQSRLTFGIYTALALSSISCLVIFVKRTLSLGGAFLVFMLTYLGVYLFSLALGLNTSWFDFVKGVDFSVISFSLCAFLFASAKGIKSFALRILLLPLSCLVLFLAVLLPSLLYCYYLATGSLISSDIIIALAQTNPREGMEFFESNVNFRWALSFAGLILLYLANVFRFLKISELSDRLSSFRLSYLATLLICVVLALPRMDYLPFSIIKVTSSQLDNFALYKEAKAKRLEALKELSDLRLSADSDPKGNLYVLVVGESETSMRMQAYGFERENTPNLVRALENSNNILFKNAISSWPQTVQALSYALTEDNQYHEAKKEKAFSLVEVARAAGFETYWLSNQRKYGVYETPVTVISSTAEHEIWVNGSSKMEGVFFDEEIIIRFPKLDEHKNILLIVHLMGSHQKYEKRLPSDYLRFQGQDENNDYYDDTVLYTDKIVKDIYDKVSSLSNFKGMVYFSDHGEDPHVVGGHDPVNVNLQMLKIPMVVYLSDSLVAERQYLKDALCANQDRFFSNDLVFELMIKLMGVEGLPVYDESYCIASKSYGLNEDNVLTMYGKEHIKAFYK